MDKQPLHTRRHPILSARAGQLLSNELALRGGTPYIAHRLTRFPYEPDGSWDGNRQNGSKGRKDRAHLVNYAARIAAKINQYVFGQAIDRNGADQSFISDATLARQSISDFMTLTSTAITGFSWAWISVDRREPSVDVQTGTVRQQSVAEREARGDRVFWRLWHPADVVDWYFDGKGALVWLITEERIYLGDDPNAEGYQQRVRTLWQRGGGTRYFFKKDNNDEIERSVTFTLSAPIVPFIPVGQISAQPWWFDDVEMMQASLLNLESAHNENLFQSVYPQMVLPASLRNDAGGGAAPAQGELTRLVGLHYPIFESDVEKDITRYITPPADALKLIPEEITRRKQELFEIVGMAMNNPQSRQVASAESKRWDNLDPSAVLAQRATLLEEAETRAVQLSKLLDTSFAVYAPSYGKTFDIADVKEDFASLLELQALDLPAMARREVLRVGIKLLDKISPIPPDRRQDIEAEIDAMDLDAQPPIGSPAKPDLPAQG